MWLAPALPSLPALPALLAAPARPAARAPAPPPVASRTATSSVAAKARATKRVPSGNPTWQGEIWEIPIFHNIS